MDAVDTIFSLEEELPAHQADEDDRAALQPGALARGSLREICFLRTITPVGALLCVDSPVRVGEPLDLALMTGERIAGRVEWVQGREVGLRFEEHADIFGLIARNLVRQPGDARRMPRIALRAAAWLEAGSRTELVTIHDLSDGGARIRTNVPLVVHEQVLLTPDGFRPLEATVRWAEDRMAGLCFTPGVPWQELMPWLKLRQPHARRMPQPPAAPPMRPAAVPQPDRPGPAEGIGLNLAARVRDGTRRWKIEVEAIDTRQVRFTCYAALEPGRLFWIALPGLEGWPARITEIDGYSVTCAFTQPLHPAVLERVMKAAKELKGG